MVVQGAQSGSDLESEVWSAIAAFEQILEAMPDDRSSLETLAHAYAHIGDQTRARDYLLRLGRVLLAEGDRAALRELRDTLEVYGDDPDVVALRAEIPVDVAEGTVAEGTVGEGGGGGVDLSPASGQAPAAGDAAVSPPTAVEPERGPRRPSPRMLQFHVSDELALAWALFGAGELSQEEYARVAQDISEMSGGRGDMTVSVLHALENRAFGNLERVVAYVARRYGTPIISLHCFDLRRDAVTLLPLEFIIRRGALVFDTIQRDALVAVMNPADARLRTDIQELIGRPCHFFVTLASEFDTAVAGIREAFA